MITTYGVKKTDYHWSIIQGEFKIEKFVDSEQHINNRSKLEYLQDKVSSTRKDRFRVARVYAFLLWA